MEIIESALNGILLIQPKVFEDARGYFFESYNNDKYKSIGIDRHFVQSNISKSMKNTIRGLHYQSGNFAQGKLCQVIVGKVLDIAVDIRFGSPTFGKHFSSLLSDENKNQVWIPEGFAHGFSVLSDFAIFEYKCTNIYNKDFEHSILYNDSELMIDWKVEAPIVSEKDKQAKTISEIDKHFTY